MTIVSPQLCTLCGLNPLTGRQTKYCSKTCEMRGADAIRQSRGGQAAYRKSIRATLTQKAREYRDRKAVDRRCRHCGTAFKARLTGTGYSSYCSMSCSKRKVSLKKSAMSYLRECARCATPFVTNRWHQIFCTSVCSGRAHGSRRDARIRGQFVEHVSPDLVFKADGWMCWLCGEEADRTAVVPDPKAPTIDHLTPLSQGGEHSYANVRTAHFYCNARRGARDPRVLEWAVEASRAA